MNTRGENEAGRSERRWPAFLLTGILAPLFLNLEYLPRLLVPGFPGTVLYGITTLILGIVMPFVLYACCGMAFRPERGLTDGRENGRRTSGERKKTYGNAQRTPGAAFRKAYTLRNFGVGMRELFPVFAISAGTVLLHIGSRMPLRRGEDLFCALAVTAAAAALTEEAAFRVFAIRLCMRILKPTNKGDHRKVIFGGKESGKGLQKDDPVGIENEGGIENGEDRYDSAAERARISVWTSAVIFALAHGGNLFTGQPLLMTVLQIGWALGMGLLIGGIFIRTGTVLPGIAAHAVNNAADACFLSVQTAGAELIFQAAASVFLLLVGIRTVMHKNLLIYQNYEL